MKFFLDNYEWITVPLNWENQVILGPKENRICRFCGLGKPMTSFKKNAHAISEMLGNKKLLTNYECDKCNEKFSQLENDLGNFTLFWRSVSSIPGKRGKPKYKKDIVVAADNGILQIGDLLTDPAAEYNTDDRTIILPGIRGPYVPMAVYKAFVKMALTVMPEDEIIHFKDTISWILEEEHVPKQITLYALIRHTPGFNVFHHITYQLFFRKQDVDSKLPYCIFAIFFSSLMVQIVIPYSEKDKQFNLHLEQGGSVDIPCLPGTYDGIHPLGASSVDVKNLSGTEQVRGETEYITISYESMEEVNEKPDDHIT
ncbi:HNH endonuclease [Paenibacillus sp. Leaf72]|uniref:HNH endonuclease n=1 Tax=Paenibacillus sp. Leaf72 TaxID=1736234 RepID=UPI0006F2054A|nr:HNH endonuclease [Paenibacillus sp. Leaf72]KQN96979.1 hypothetical protein ASF12_23205 [Paenibacillus sp. Leaf72]